MKNSTSSVVLEAPNSFGPISFYVCLNDLMRCTCHNTSFEVLESEKCNWNVLLLLKVSELYSSVTDIVAVRTSLRGDRCENPVGCLLGSLVPWRMWSLYSGCIDVSITTVSTVV